jgi:hypothetical protein
MTPAALLVCMTIVTNVNHGSEVRNDCHFEQPAVAMATEITKTPAATIAITTTQMPDTGVKALAALDMTIAAKPEKPRYKKTASRSGKARHRVAVKTVKPIMTAEQNKSFRYSWFKRLAGL